MSYSKYTPPHDYTTSSSSSSFQSNDLLRIAGLTLIPFGTMGAAFVIMGDKAKENLEYYGKLEKPCWAITDPNTMIGLDVATLAPVGYAVHLITRDGCQSDDVKKALGAFGGVLGLYLLSTVAFSKSKDLKCWAGAGFAVGGAAGLASYLFGKLDKTAGYLMMPFAAWCLFYSVQTMAMACKQCEKKKQP